MASIAIVGPSGTGKSTSYGQFPELGIKGLNPKETVVINVSNKDLPFRGWKKMYSGKLTEGGNYMSSSDSTQISQAINFISEKRPDVKNVVIDDGQFLMAFEFMRRAKENGYNKFTDLGVNMAKVAEAARMSKQKVFFLWHPEKDRDNGFKMKTVGAMVDSYLTLEGLFTVILYSKVSMGTDNKPVYQFVTNNDGEYPSKTPVSMFKDLYIPNDLGVVAEMIDKYNEGE